MTYSQLVSAVRNYLNRPEMPEEDVSLLIATAEGELNRVLREHPRNIVYDATTTFQGASLPIPENLIGLISLRDEKGLRYWQRSASSEGEVAPCQSQPTYVDKGSCYVLSPMPEQGRRIYMDYHAALEPLSNAQPENWVSKLFPDVYLYAVLKEAAVFLKDDQRLAAWQKEFDRRAGELRLQGWNQSIASSPRISL